MYYFFRFMQIMAFTGAALCLAIFVQAAFEQMLDPTIDVYLEALCSILAGAAFLAGLVFGDGAREARS